MDYKQVFEESYKSTQEDSATPVSRIVFLADCVFDFTTYDDDMSLLFGTKAVEVCTAINNSTTSNYIDNEENYKWYLLLCNMPFFVDKLNWGTSIRGAWWDTLPNKNIIELETISLWYEGKQIRTPLLFTCEEWKTFISAIIEFATPEMNKPYTGVGDG